MPNRVPPRGGIHWVVTGRDLGKTWRQKGVLRPKQEAQDATHYTKCGARVVIACAAAVHEACAYRTAAQVQLIAEPVVLTLVANVLALNHAKRMRRN